MADIRGGGIWWDLEVRGKNFEAAINAQAAKGVSGEKKVQAAAKAANAPYDERIAKMHELLGLTEKQTAANQAANAKMSFLDRTMQSMGAKIGKGGMMGAQLSYAAQDFLTGLAMGNLNMAIMGASNNLGMMAMQISSAAAAWTTMGLVAIPLAVTAIKAFTGAEDEAKIEQENLRKAIDRVNESYARRIAILGQQSNIRRAGMPIDEADIRTAGGANSQIKNAQRDIEALTADAAAVARQKELTRREKESKGIHVAEFAADQRRIATESLRNREAEVRERQEKAIGAVGLTMLHDAQGNLEAERKRIAIENGYDKDHRAFLTARGSLEIVRLRTAEELAELDKKSKDLEQKGGEIEADIAANKAKVAELTKHHERNAKIELEFLQREAGAGFNKYQQGLIKLDREKRLREIELEEMGFGKILTKPQMSIEEFNKRDREIDEKAESDTQKTYDDMQALREKKRLHGRLLTQKEIQSFDTERQDIEKRRIAEHQKNAEELQNPPTLLDEAKRTMDEDFRRRRIELASGIAQGRTGITGIADLSRQIQTGLLGGGGVKTAEQTAANTAAMNQALKALLNDGIKIKNPQDIGGGPAKWGPN